MVKSRGHRRRRCMGLKGLDGQIASWQLFNSLGRMIREGRDTSIDMGGISRGLYYLRLEQEDGRFIQHQVTKQ